MINELYRKAAFLLEHLAGYLTALSRRLSKEPVSKSPLPAYCSPRHSAYARASEIVREQLASLTTDGPAL